MATSRQEESIQIQGWGMGSVSSPPLLLRYSGEPQPHVHRFYHPDLVLQSTLLATMRFPLRRMKVLTMAIRRHPVLFVLLPFLLHLAILRQVMGLYQGCPRILGFRGRSRIVTRQMGPHLPRQLAPRLRRAHPVETHLCILLDGVLHSLRTGEEGSSRVVIPLRNTSHDNGTFVLWHYTVLSRNVSRSRSLSYSSFLFLIFMCTIVHVCVLCLQGN